MTDALRTSFIVTCKGRLSHLKQSLPALVVQKNSETILVDYSCEDGCGDWASTNHPETTIVQVIGEKDFCLSRARNIGAKKSSGDVLCFIDADAIASENLSSHVLEITKVFDYAGFSGLAEASDLFGFLCVKRDIFEKIGGYDEAFKGWGGEDIDIRFRLKNAGYKFSPIKQTMITSIPHGDELRQINARHPSEKLSRNMALQASQLYMHIKIDISNNFNEPPLEVRSNIFNACAAEIKRASETNTNASISVNLPQKSISRFSSRINKKIIYEVTIT